MEHIAIDLGGKESQICVRSSAGEIVEEKRIRTDRIEPYLGNRLPSRVIIETSAESFWVADGARAHGHDVRVVPATLARTLGVGARGVKTDLRDARALSEVSTRVDLPSVHIPSSVARERKALCTSREVLVAARTKLINSVRGWMRTCGNKTSRRGSGLFTSRMKELHDQLPNHIQRIFTVIEELTVQIRQADKEVEAIAKSDETCIRLMTVPGVGPITSVRFASAVDDATRFHSSHHVESYFGLVPGERSSSDKKHRTGLTKAGNPKVRWTLVQAAWVAWRHRPDDPMVRWAQNVAQRRGNKVAILALARKMAGILFAIIRDATMYDACRGADWIDRDGVIHNANP